MGQDLILITRPNLLGRAFAPQMSLSGFAKLDLPCAGYLKSLGDAFMRLLHDVLEKRGYL